MFQYKFSLSFHNLYLIYILHCRLVGDCLLSTGFLSYSGPFNQEFRNKLNKNWQKELDHRRIPFTSDLNLISMLVDNATASCISFISYILEPPVYISFHLSVGICCLDVFFDNTYG
jgi:hypothetical protein